MITSAKMPSAMDGKDASMLELVDELVRKLQAGDEIDLDELGGHDPARVEQLRQLLPTLEKLADLGLSVTSGADVVASAHHHGLGRARWATSGSSARSAGAAWGSSTRPCRSR